MSRSILWVVSGRSESFEEARWRASYEARSLLNSPEVWAAYPLTYEVEPVISCPYRSLSVIRGNVDAQVFNCGLDDFPCVASKQDLRVGQDAEADYPPRDLQLCPEHPDFLGERTPFCIDSDSSVPYKLRGTREITQPLTSAVALARGSNYSPAG